MMRNGQNGPAILENKIQLINVFGHVIISEIRISGVWNSV